MFFLGTFSSTLPYLLLGLLYLTGALTDSTWQEDAEVLGQKIEFRTHSPQEITQLSDAFAFTEEVCLSIITVNGFPEQPLEKFLHRLNTTKRAEYQNNNELTFSEHQFIGWRYALAPPSHSC